MRKIIQAIDAKEGMVLASELIDKMGRCLASPNTVLTPMHIARLDKWGIKEISIQEITETDTNANDESATIQIDQDSILAEQKTKLDNMFREVKNEPTMLLIKNIAIEVLSEKADK